MTPFPPDKYHFRRVLLNVLILPATLVWLYVLLFYVSLVPAVLLSSVLALTTTFVLAYGIHWIGYAIVTALDKRLDQRDKNGREEMSRERGARK